MDTKITILNILVGTALTFSSCSSYEDPDNLAKGAIDEAVLTTIARGDVAMVLNTYDANEYVRDYSSEKGEGIGKWRVSDYIGGVRGCNPLSFKTYNGKGWTYLEEEEYSGSPNKSSLAALWDLYCMYTGINESFSSFFIYCPIEYKPESKTLIVGGNELKVLKADNDFITCSHVSLGYGGADFTPQVEFKTIATYRLHYVDPVSFENRYFFESVTEAHLYIVRKLREYFGDVIDETYSEDLGFYGQLIYDLAKLEEYLLEGKSDGTSGWRWPYGYGSWEDYAYGGN